MGTTRAKLTKAGVIGAAVLSGAWGTFNYLASPDNRKNVHELWEYVFGHWVVLVTGLLVGLGVGFLATWIVMDLIWTRRSQAAALARARDALLVCPP